MIAGQGRANLTFGSSIVLKPIFRLIAKRYRRTIVFHGILNPIAEDLNAENTHNTEITPAIGHANQILIVI
jgi:hypothetical protein